MTYQCRKIDDYEIIFVSPPPRNPEAIDSTSIICTPKILSIAVKTTSARRLFLELDLRDLLLPRPQLKKGLFLESK